MDSFFSIANGIQRFYVGDIRWMYCIVVIVCEKHIK